MLLGFGYYPGCRVYGTFRIVVIATGGESCASCGCYESRHQIKLEIFHTLFVN